MTRTAIVTGGARGIGRACALALDERGYDIALVDLLKPEMERTAGELSLRSVKSLLFEADVSNFARAHVIVAEVAAHWGGIDVLVNNAGGPNPKGILEISEAEFDRTISVNLKSCFNFIHAVAPVMLGQEKGGRIVSMSSLNALSGGVTSAVSKHSYAAAKAGILGLTRSLAKELGPKIAINAICPGVIKTELGNSLRTVASRSSSRASPWGAWARHPMWQASSPIWQQPNRCSSPVSTSSSMASSGRVEV